MKKIFLFTCIFFSLINIHAQQLQIPKQSPLQIIKQEFANGSIEMNYSRPGLKGRSIGTDFVPYGELWRTGANGATTISFSDDVIVGTTKVAKGTYGLLSIPGEKEWVLILTTDLDVNYMNKYKKEHDVVRVTAPIQKLNSPIETFTIDFSKFTLNSCVIQFSWDHTLVELPISTDIETKISEDINRIFFEDDKPYYAAAKYYFDTNKDLNQAKEWIEKATADEKHANMLHMFWLQAQVYQKLGEKENAKKTANLLIEKATKMGNQDYVTKCNDLIKAL